MVLFTWLLLADRILTWNTLQRRGFEGPGICLLCHSAEENAMHLMIKCPYTIQVWQHIGLHFNTDLIWHGLHATEAFFNWITGDYKLRTLPILVCIFIWLARNSYIFRNIYTTPLQIVNQAHNFWYEDPKLNGLHRSRIIQQPSFMHDKVIGYFDGASQEGGTRCGVGAILISPILGRYNIMWNCGNGTNTRFEMLALWSLLYYARTLDIDTIQIVGDSKVIVDWAKG